MSHFIHKDMDPMSQDPHQKRIQFTVAGLLEDGGGSPQPGNADWKLKKKKIVACNLQKRMWSCQHLNLSSVKPMLDFRLGEANKYWCRFKTLSLW